MSIAHRLKVAHVTLGLEMGGQEKLLVEFARHANRDRFDLHFVVLGRRGPLAGAIEECGWTVRTLDFPEGVRPDLILCLAKLFRRGGFDVIHTHDDRPLVYGAPAARLGGVPTVIHTHHHGKLPRVSERQAHLVRFASRFVRDFVCVSQDSARYVIASGVARKKTRVRHNGIDLSRFSYVGPNAAGPALAVARLSPEKGIDVLLRAAVQVLRAVPQFRLQIAGNGPCFAQLERQAHDLKLTDAVQFLGEVRDVAELLARSRLFILPSFSEGISLTLLEAMARGLPVVATRVGGVPEVVVDGETGLLVPAHEVNALARGIVSLWNDAERGARWGRAGRQRVEENFDIRRMVAQYEDLYIEHAPKKDGSLLPCAL